MPRVADPVEEPLPRLFRLAPGEQFRADAAQLRAVVLEDRFGRVVRISFRLAGVGNAEVFTDVKLPLVVRHAVVRFLRAGGDGLGVGRFVELGLYMPGEFSGLLEVVVDPLLAERDRLRVALRAGGVVQVRVATLAADAREDRAARVGRTLAAGRDRTARRERADRDLR